MTRVFRADRRWRLIVVGMVVATMVGCSPGEPPPPPNVVLIVVDALRADHLSHYGYSRDTSLHLDGFAARATRFADCTAPASWTNPSVASLFTGFYPVRHRAHELGAPLSSELHTVAEGLSSGGWHTAAISFNPSISSELGYGQGFDLFDEEVGRATDYPDISEMVDRVAAWLDTRPPEPFFLYLHPMNVHGPYRVPEAQRDVLLGRAPDDDFQYYGEPMSGILRRGEIELRREVSEAYIRSLVDTYDTAIRYTTDQLAVLFGMLDEAGLYDPSLIILTADHGEELFDHGGFSHGYSLHREVLDVPLYIKLPFQSEGRVVPHPVELIDIMPTVLELTANEAVGEPDGSSLAPLLSGTVGPIPTRKTRLYQTVRQHRCVARSIAGPRFKLIEITRNYEGLRDVVRLYDRYADPGELEDVSTERPEVVERLQRGMKGRFHRLAESAIDTTDNRLEELDRDRLEALGYLE